jgi:hypothetical protein
VKNIQQESPFQTFKRLWSQAPLWRSAGIGAAVLTLMFILFFHAAPQPSASTSATAQASYVPAPAATVAQSSPSAASSNAPVNAASAAGATPQSPATTSSARGNPQTANLSLATPGNSQTPPGQLNKAMGGHSYSGSLHFDGFDVPLPAGNWVVLSSGHVKTPKLTGELVFLGEIKNQRLVGAVRMSALRAIAMPGDGFQALKGCSESNVEALYVSPEAIVPNAHQSCWLIDGFFTTPLQAWADRANKIPGLERAAAGDLAAKGVTYPQDFVRVRMTRAEKWGLLEVAYIFSPEIEGIKSDDVISLMDSDWAATNISRFPEKVAYVNKLKQWAKQMWPTFKSSFDKGAPKS